MPTNASIDLPWAATPVRPRWGPWIQDVVLAFALACGLGWPTPSWRWIDCRLVRLPQETLWTISGDASAGLWVNATLQTLLPLIWALSAILLHPAVAAATASSASRSGVNALLHDFRVRRWLRRPTYLLLAVMLINVEHYYRLWWYNRNDTYPIPMCLFVLLLLLAWLRSRPAAVPTATSAPLPRRLAAGAMMVLLLVMGLFFSFGLRPPTQPADLAVVFGNRVLDDGSAGDTLRDRTLAAVDLYHRGLVKKLLLSGAIDPTQGGWHSEATAMKNVCLAAGVPAEDLLLDPVGNNSRYTVYNSLEVARKNGWHSLVAVSSDYHLPRIRLDYARRGVTVATAAARPAVWTQSEPVAVVREFVGLAVYWLNPRYNQPKAEAMTIRTPRLVVKKAAGTLELFDGPRLVKTYAVTTGAMPGDKEREGDKKTPEGAFAICYKNPESKFHLSLGLNYPNLEDAQRGRDAGLLTPGQFEQIANAIRSGGIPDWYTPLGGEIFIHGQTGKPSSAGCIVTSNRDIEELYAICDVGTPVEIHP